ncbi:UPF0047 protein C4A8.02c-like protein [Leptotrombidium deliense]|uniref:UPF0047 protein C4A8.02c-like protein n=1 Tax=Leptotrombidium deliense TaxID=299467 RepID=A0A443SMX0_9ACAR|nr:UPF0047 protein C4A8.02c-like protein [Leptotrombidium deliense]
MSSMGKIIEGKNAWFQKMVMLPPFKFGCHLITDHVVKNVEELSKFKVGLCNIQILHTSASLTINENYDPDVRDDLTTFLDHLVPESFKFKHCDEGPDDMPAHVKNSLTDTSISVPITDGKLNFGSWQGIYLCEHRRSKHTRKLIVTINGILNS